MTIQFKYKNNDIMLRVVLFIELLDFYIKLMEKLRWLVLYDLFPYNKIIKPKNLKSKIRYKIQIHDPNPAFHSKSSPTLSKPHNFYIKTSTNSKISQTNPNFPCLL